MCKCILGLYFRIPVLTLFFYGDSIDWQEQVLPHYERNPSTCRLAATIACSSLFVLTHVPPAPVRASASSLSRFEALVSFL